MALQDNSIEEFDSIPTIHLSPYHEIHLADALTLEYDSKNDTNAEQASDEAMSDSDNQNVTTDSFRVPICDVRPVKSSEARTHWAALATSMKRNRAFLLSATVHKETRNDKIGLCLSNNSKKGGRALTISSIHEEGLFSHSPFQVGDRIVSINTLNCQEMRASVAARLLRTITGTFTVVVQNVKGDPTLVESMIYKPEPTSKTGLSVISNGYSRATIYDIHPHGIFADSILNRMDLIVSINEIPCHSLDSREAAAIVAQAEDRVTVIAERRHESAVVMAMAQ
ncbi:expressed unknown protein [Seminavis robusta]|uniref:PDZ domain-containing protein n=1 Tax=Seminavis robusta TaxID=568900 RepID=A0A9N8EFM8_9STRA|nr:expressed unknown protein [Seminavis robusta]|eukprot:Sro874_g214230.1 n/a (282) ;mRNA; f:24778-25623